MITCPSCNHQNPEGSLQCENCYTPLPATTSCPNCGTSVQADATFCGQCGFNLQAENPLTETSIGSAVEETAVGSLPDLSLEELSSTGAISEMPLAEAESDILPETTMTSPINSPWDDEDFTQEDLTQGQPMAMSEPELEVTEMMNPLSIHDIDLGEDTTGIDPNMPGSMPWEADSPDLDTGIDTGIEELTISAESDEETISEDLSLETPPLSAKTETELKTDVESESFSISPELDEELEVEEATSTTNLEPIPQPNPAEAVGSFVGATQLQVQTASLLHLQTNTTIEIADLDVVHIGKPNGQIPPDIDVAGFPDSEVVSRVHADIRIEGDAYYLEDVGSSNGTYINHTPLLKGNRHRLRSGDRIALGKGDLVTFIFQIE